MTQPALFHYTAEDLLHDTRADFDGAVCTKEDTPRLKGQLLRVYALLKGGAWWTVEELHVAILSGFGVSDPMCSLSAQIRNLKKDKYGGFPIEKRRRHGSHLWEYRMKEDV